MTPCNYTAADLSSTGERVLSDFSHVSPRSVTTLHGPLTIHPSHDWQHEILFRFCNRTVLTMGSPNTITTYAEVVPRLAIQHDHLLHIIVATTLLHDRALGVSPSTVNESYHLGYAAAMFNQKLSNEIPDTDKDAIWVTAVYMVVTSMFNIPSLDIEQSWPITTHPDDLKWLNLQAGLRVVWSLTDLHRPNGKFAEVGEYPDEDCVFPRLPAPGITGLPPLLVDLCGLTELSNATNDPYHTASRHLSWLLPKRCTPDNILSFMIFAGGMTPAFKDLLHDRDPRALLLMGIWYSRVFDVIWWIAPRAQVEGQAIYRYLDRLQVKDGSFQQVLGMLGRACELRSSRSICSTGEEWIVTPLGASSIPRSVKKIVSN